MSQFRRPIEAYRLSSGRYVNGRWEEGARNQISVTASVQPANDKDMQSLPEGRREASTFAIFTSMELLGPSEDGKTNPDILILFGDEYEVVSVERWQNSVINHYKALAQRKSVKPCAATGDNAGPVVLTDELVIPQ